MILPEDKVEQWLAKIQEMMIKTLYDITKIACDEYPPGGIERKDWLFGEYPAQTILTVDIIKWTEKATIAIYQY